MSQNRLKSFKSLIPDHFFSVERSRGTIQLSPIIYDNSRALETGLSALNLIMCDKSRALETGLSALNPILYDNSRALETGLSPLNLIMCDKSRALETGLSTLNPIIYDNSRALETGLSPLSPNMKMLGLKAARPLYKLKKRSGIRDLRLLEAILAHLFGRCSGLRLRDLSRS